MGVGSIDKPLRRLHQGLSRWGEDWEEDACFTLFPNLRPTAARAVEALKLWTNKASALLTHTDFNNGSSNMNTSEKTKLDCTLSILVARTDVRFMCKTIPHIVKSCGCTFRERHLLVDTAPLSPQFAARPHVGTEKELLAMCEKMKEEGWVDELKFLNYADPARQSIEERHFGRILENTHDYRGYPIYGSVWPIETCQSRYFVHFDSDILLHTNPSFSWVARGIEILKADESALFVGPRPGPPSKKNLPSQSVNYEKKELGYYFKHFTSRRFLLDVERLRTVLPLNPRQISLARRIVKKCFQSPAYIPWEQMITLHLQKKNMYRVDLDGDDCWALHTPDHGTGFVQQLPALITTIEKGWFPKAQAGNFQLDLSKWLEQLS